MAEMNQNGPGGPVDGDAGFAGRAMAALPSVPVPAALEARILADFDAVAARRKSSPWRMPARLAGRWRDIVWPGAPVWKPVSIFALSLLIGLAAGALVPSSTTASSTEQTQTTASDTSPALDLSGEL